MEKDLHSAGRGIARASLTAFIFVVVCGSCFQLLFLPRTDWHAGEGLMVGGDWVVFHQLAKSLAEAIEVEGWHLWELRPGGQAPSGIAAALYVITGVALPIVLLPLHGALYAVSAGTLYSLLRSVGASSRVASYGLFSLFLFPSTAIIWGQFHKDIYSTAGTLLVLRFWITVWQLGGARDVSWRKSIMACVGLMGGIGLIWLVRPYLVEVIFLCSVVSAVLIMLVWVCRLRVAQEEKKRLGVTSCASDARRRRGHAGRSGDGPGWAAIGARVGSGGEVWRQGSGTSVRDMGLVRPVAVGVRQTAGKGGMLPRGVSPSLSGRRIEYR